MITLLKLGRLKLSFHKVQEYLNKVYNLIHTLIQICRVQYEYSKRHQGPGDPEEKVGEKGEAEGPQKSSEML